MSHCGRPTSSFSSSSSSLPPNEMKDEQLPAAGCLKRTGASVKHSLTAYRDSQLSEPETGECPVVPPLSQIFYKYAVQSKLRIITESDFSFSIDICIVEKIQHRVSRLGKPARARGIRLLKPKPRTTYKIRLASRCLRACIKRLRLWVYAPHRCVRTAEGLCGAEYKEYSRASRVRTTLRSPSSRDK